MSVATPFTAAIRCRHVLSGKGRPWGESLSEERGKCGLEEAIDEEVVGKAGQGKTALVWNAALVSVVNYTDP
jgi:predicted ribonuclease YlaK